MADITTDQKGLGAMEEMVKMAVEESMEQTAERILERMMGLVLQQIEEALKGRAELEDEYYAATYALDQSQGIEEPLEEAYSGREPSKGSGVSKVVYFLLGMGLIWLLLRRW